MRTRQLQNAIGGIVDKESTEKALTALSAAVNQDEAAQFTLAVFSYQNALRMGSDVVPAKVIGARLDAIKTAHPAEFADGMKMLTSNTPLNVSYEGSCPNPGAIVIPGRG